MRSKVVAAEMATAAGIPTVIASGLEAGMIPRPPPVEPVGTRFPARDGRYSSFKLWLKYAKPTRGRVLVDAGAARALREGGTSLLPVGVVEVAGDFAAGDAVEVAHDGPAGRQGDLQLLGRRAAPGPRPASRPRCASGCRGPATRRSTATTSCSREPASTLVTRMAT